MTNVLENSNDRIVTIFGGSQFGPETPEYRDAEDLGFRLAEAGFTICTGGYLGVMEAASRGARNAGGRVFGIVMNQFRSEPNRYLTDKVATNHFLRTASESDHKVRRVCRPSRRYGNRYRDRPSLEQTADRGDRTAAVGADRRQLA
jgi:predicted Rossmann fold nucleotide-binding protein DprA/Smf involved in DNA uptake